MLIIPILGRCRMTNNATTNLLTVQMKSRRPEILSADYNKLRGVNNVLLTSHTRTCAAFQILSFRRIGLFVVLVLARERLASYFGLFQWDRKDFWPIQAVDLV